MYSHFTYIFGDFSYSPKVIYIYLIDLTHLNIFCTIFANKIRMFTKNTGKNSLHLVVTIWKQPWNDKIDNYDINCSMNRTDDFFHSCEYLKFDTLLHIAREINEPCMILKITPCRILAWSMQDQQICKFSKFFMFQTSLKANRFI